AQTSGGAEGAGGATGAEGTVAAEGGIGPEDAASAPINVTWRIFCATPSSSSWKSAADSPVTKWPFLSATRTSTSTSSVAERNVCRGSCAAAISSRARMPARMVSLTIEGVEGLARSSKDRQKILLKILQLFALLRLLRL